MDRYTIGNDLDNVPTTIVPLEPRGCRYFEVHVVFDDVRVTSAEHTGGFLYRLLCNRLLCTRCYHLLCCCSRWDR